MERKGRNRIQGRIEALVRRGALEEAAAAYVAHLETEPDDWNAVNALGELYVRQGQDEAALTQFRRVADHLFAEGFLARAAAIYKRMLRLREEDHPLLSLIDIAAREGQLAEAKAFLVQLASARRARGDEAGAEECLRVFDAILDARSQLPANVVDAPGITPPPAVEDELGPVAPWPGTAEHDEPVEPVSESSTAPATALPDVENELPRIDEVPASITPTRRPTTRGRRPARGRQQSSARPLQNVFDEMRAREQQEAAAAAAHERFDLAQYHLREGDEVAAIRELRQAAEAPFLRFMAAAQLGRLHLARGETAEAIAWLERAAGSPPVSPDEGLSVLYELGDALERSGEPARALAVFLELKVQRPSYRDLAARIAHLSQADAQDAHE